MKDMCKALCQIAEKFVLVIAGGVGLWTFTNQFQVRELRLVALVLGAVMLTLGFVPMAWAFVLAQLPKQPVKLLPKKQ